MRKIILLVDYKDRFGLKHFDIPYRSGMNKQILKQYFQDNDYDVSFLKFNEIDFSSDYKDQLVLYTSSEDIGYHYKNYIEDIVYGLELAGAIVIPGYKYLHANNNKVFMEILRNQSSLNEIKNIASYHFGSLVEIKTKLDTLKYPLVFKLAEGASGSNVKLVKSKKDLIKTVKKYCRTRYLQEDLWDLGRSGKHKGYIKESLYRQKFILQEFIPNLVNDWKIYVFYDKYYIFYRPVFEHREFKASGGGYDNYFYGINAQAPEGIFDYAELIYNKLGVPNVSLDIAFDGKFFYLIEFQSVYFGTAGILYSNEYFIKNKGEWIYEQNEKDIEKVYVHSITEYVKNKNCWESCL